MNKLPKWIAKETECNFCRSMTEAGSVYVDGDDVRVSYVCNNPKCYYRRLFNEDHEFIMIYHGRKKVYNKFLSNKSETTTSTGLSGTYWGGAK